VPISVDVKFHNRSNTPRNLARVTALCNRFSLALPRRPPLMQTRAGLMGLDMRLNSGYVCILHG